METGVIIVAVLFAILVPSFIGLVAWSAKRTRNDVDELQKSEAEQNIRLARGDERMNVLDEIRTEQRAMHDDILVIKSNCPKCDE